MASPIPRETSDEDNITVDTGTDSPASTGVYGIGIAAALSQGFGGVEHQPRVSQTSAGLLQQQNPAADPEAASAPDREEGTAAAAAAVAAAVAAAAAATAAASTTTSLPHGGASGAAATTAATTAVVATTAVSAADASAAAAAAPPPFPSVPATPAAVRQEYQNAKTLAPNADGHSSPLIQGSPITSAVGEEDGSGVKAAAPKRRRLLRLDNGGLAVLPTNIYKQAGGVKLDLSLGSFRIDGDKCTMKNRAFNFGVLPGFTKENLLALRAFRDIIIPPDRSGATIMCPIAAAEALKRYDEEHLQPPEGAEPSPYEGIGGWIPGARELHVTFVGSNMEMRVKASELRAIDRPLQCKLALEALRSDPKVIGGEVEMVQPASRGPGLSGSDRVGVEPGSTGFSRAPSATGYTAPASSAVGVEAFKFNIPGASYDGSISGGGMDGGGDAFSMKQRRRKRKKSVVAEDGVAYDLPTYVQNVETKLHKSTLRLKMPLTGFLVNGEDVSVADLVVAHGLDVTRRNLLALRACRDAVMTNFAGPVLVQRIVAAEIFYVWTKRRGDTTASVPNADAKEAADAAISASQAVQNARTIVEAHARDVSVGAGGPQATAAAPKEQAKDLAQELEEAIAVGRRSATDGNGTGTGVAPFTTVAGAIPAPSPGTKISPKLDDDDMIYLAGPASSPGAPRIQVQMTVGDLRRARQSRVGEFKQLLMAMLSDPIVQAGKLDIVTHPTSPTPTLTQLNSSGAAAAAAAGRAQAAAARALEDTTRAMALLASGRERDGGTHGGGLAVTPMAPFSGHRADSEGYTNGGGVSVGLAPSTVQRLDGRSPTADLSGSGATADPVLQPGKRARADTDAGGEDRGGKKVSGVGAGGREEEILPVAAAGGGGSTGEAATLSKRRRQLWMQAIRENELRHERRKEEAKREYETRQQQLLRWMIDEEAGRHNDCDGDAGPPPMV